MLGVEDFAVDAAATPLWDLSAQTAGIHEFSKR